MARTRRPATRSVLPSVVPRGTRPARRRRGAWTLVALVIGAWLVAFVLSATGAAPSIGGGEPLTGGRGPDRTGPAGTEETEGQPQVVVVGVPGLTWEVIDERTTPTLARLAREGGTAALVLRGTHEVTCSADAWLTLGAGQRAATDVQGCEGDRPGTAPAGDEPAPVDVEQLVQGGSVDPGTWDSWRRAAASGALDARLGTLSALAGAGGTCVAAYGAEAVLGAAGPDGAAAVFVPSTGAGIPQPAPGRAGTSSGLCRIHLVTAPPVLSPTGGDAGASRPRGPDPLPAGAIDAEIEQVAAELPDGTTLVVAGLGHTGGRAETTALVVHPVGDRAGGGAALSSGSTQQRGLVQLTDLTPTALLLAGVELPTSAPSALAGQPVTVLPGDDGHVAQTRDLAAGVSLAKSSAPWVLGATAVLLLPLLVLAAVLRRGRLLTVLATTATAVPVASFLAGLLPWWRASSPVTALTLTVLGLAALVAALARSGPWRRDPLAPVATVAAVTLAVLGVDMICSARLGLVSVLGLQPVTAGRFYGQGNVGFGIALGAFLVLAAALLTWLGGRDGVAPRARPGHGPGAGQPAAVGSQPVAGSWSAAAAVALLGGAFTVVGAAPWGGADFGGVLAVVVATGLLVLTALGLRWTPGVTLGLGLLGVVVAASVMVLDWLRGPERRTHLGGFVQHVLDGEALGIVTRKLDQSLGILVAYPLSWLAVVALALFAVVVVRRPAWSAPLWRQEGLRPAALAGLVAMVLGWVLNDSGIAVVALALTVLVGAALAVVAEPHRDRSVPGSDGPRRVG